MITSYLNNSSNTEHEADATETTTTQTGHWYAVYWHNNKYWFVGRVIQKGHLVKLEFIHQTFQGINRFKTANDIDTIPGGDVLTEVRAPTPVSSTCCSLLHLTDEDYNTAIDSYTSFCHA